MAPSKAAVCRARKDKARPVAKPVPERRSIETRTDVIERHERAKAVERSKFPQSQQG